jgi:hypothetical protein
MQAGSEYSELKKDLMIVPVEIGETMKLNTFSLRPGNRN